jgi:hypothetical protein
MTETVICVRCKCSFERIIVEAGRQEHTIDVVIEEIEPVCNDCEHEFLTWTGCMPTV